MRIALVGSRGIDESHYFKLNEIIPKDTTMLISGGASGADALAEKYAEENNLSIKIIPPDYKKYGKSAPLKRNVEIIKESDRIIALWDGKSRGTAFVIVKCIEMGVPVRIYICS